MNIIKFSEPFDKLRNLEGFTTIRRSTPEKAEYYHKAIGELFDISLLGKIIGKGILKEVHDTTGREINRDILDFDVSMNGQRNYDWYFKIQNMGPVLLLYFERVY
jgi:hypothetical protein